MPPTLLFRELAAELPRAVMPGERNIYHTAPVEPKVSVTLYGAPGTPQPGRLPLPVLDDISGLELDETGCHRTDPFNTWGRRGRLRRARFRLHLSLSRSAICSSCTPFHLTTASESW